MLDLLIDLWMITFLLSNCVALIGYKTIKIRKDSRN